MKEGTVTRVASSSQRYVPSASQCAYRTLQVTGTAVIIKSGSERTERDQHLSFQREVIPDSRGRSKRGEQAISREGDTLMTSLSDGLVGLLFGSGGATTPEI